MLQTTGKTAALRLTEEKTQADDVKIVIVEAVDDQGNRVPYDCRKVFVETLENAVLVGFGTGDPVTEENFTTRSCTLYEGRALMVLRKIDHTKDCRVVLSEQNAQLELF